MRHPIRHSVALLAACLFLAPPAGPARAAGPAGAQQFFQHPDIAAARLSPSGNYLALVKRIAGKRYGVVVLPTARLTDAAVIASSGQTDILEVQWVNEERLIFMTGDTDETGIGNRNGDVYAVNRDGSDLMQLIAGNAAYQGDTLSAQRTAHVLPGTYRVLETTRDDSDAIMVGQGSFSAVDGSMRKLMPYRLDTKTRALEPVVEGTLPTVPVSWVFDTSGVARILTGIQDGRRSVYYRAGPSAAWQLLGDFDAVSGEGFVPQFFGYDDTLYARAGHASDTNALYRYDLKEHRLQNAPILAPEGFDFVGWPEYDPAARKLLGFHYLTDAWGTVWLDEQMKSAQRLIDQALVHTVNTLSCGNCLSSRFLLVTARSDQLPAAYYLFDPNARRLTKIADALPALADVPMGSREFYRYAARDGRSIPVYVTLPPGKTQGPLPAVVLVHGGPFARGASWEWSAGAQFLATRGYLVIEPEFRGSTGFGYAHFRAGWRQWGLAMQDDLADAAKWAIAKGLADPKRIAIGGASYGGYATLMGLIKDPEVFRCGFEWVGVTDLSLLYSVSWNDAPLAQLSYSMPRMIGDPVKDALQFQATSPLANASRLNAPLLMAYGAEDRRVPVVHGQKFRDAVRANNPNVEWIVYPLEGHGWHIEEDAIDFWQHVERFLEANLKNAPLSATP